MIPGRAVGAHPLPKTMWKHQLQMVIFSYFRLVSEYTGTRRLSTDGRRAARRSIDRNHVHRDTALAQPLDQVVHQVDTRRLVTEPLQRVLDGRSSAPTTQETLPSALRRTA